ncbi:uncharacterized protein [Panulirus ornatus]|uniref:uncharacterized protein n=1 Tax=Panulirus ornatus TaxID=150431 RepID=UPI003A88AEF1
MMTRPGSIVVTLMVLAMMVVTPSNTLPNDNKTVLTGFQSGFLYVTPERRLTFPPSTVLVITPTLSLPMGRDLPVSFGASMTTSIPFRINFDHLGMTSEDNNWGIIRNKREAPTDGDLAGGDREVMYRVVEDTLQTMGVDGKACLLRAICEISELPLQNYGFFGEVLELFLSPSRSPRAARRLQQYQEAEHRGKSELCLQYHQACPYSFFTSADVNNTSVEATYTAPPSP